MSAIQVEPHGHGTSGATAVLYRNSVRDQSRDSIHQRSIKRIRERMAVGFDSTDNGNNSADVDCSQQSANANGSGRGLKPAVVRLLLPEWLGSDSAFRLANSGSNSWDASRCISLPVGAVSDGNRGRALVQENMTILSPTALGAALITAILAFESVTPWWQGVIVAVVGAPLSAGIALYVNLLLQKRNHRVELEKTGDQSYAELGHVVLELTDKERGRLEAGLQRVAEQAEKVHIQQLQFLQEQLRHQGNLEVQARNRSHRALAEVQRCLMTIRAYEEQMRTGEVAFEPFTFKSYDDIIGDDKIPTIPEGS